jgi:hypothetical protein
MDRMKDMQEHTKNTKNCWLKASSRTVRQGCADRPRGAQTAARARPLEGQHHLPTTRSPESTKGLLPNHRWRWSASRRCYSYEFVASNPMNRGIEILPSSSTRLGFQLKSFNRRPNSKFEGSWSSTKMHKETIHDPHQQIRTQTPQNQRNKPHTKIQRK